MVSQNGGRQKFDRCSFTPLAVGSLFNAEGLVLALVCDAPNAHRRKAVSGAPIRQLAAQLPFAKGGNRHVEVIHGTHEF